jgi:hypothetical protein
VAAAFARLVSRLDDPVRETCLLAAVAVVQQYEDRADCESGQWRICRIEHTLTALAETRTPAEIEVRLNDWRHALGSAAPLTSVLAPLLPQWSEAEIGARLGPIAPSTVPALAAAWARAGRLDDALGLAAARDARTHAAALDAIADVSLTEKQAARLARAFEKCPKEGRERDEQTMWKHQRAELRLRVGLVDDAIAALAQLPFCRYIGIGPEALAIRIAGWLDHTNGWNAARAQALFEALAASGVIAQSLPEALVTVAGAAWRHARPTEATLASLRGRFRRSDDAAVVELAAAVGMASSGDGPGAARTLAAALTALEGGQPYFVRPALVVRAARAVADATAGQGSVSGDAFFGRAAALALRLKTAEAIDAFTWIAGSVRPSELPALRALLDTPATPDAIVQPSRDALARRLAEPGVSNHEDAIDALAALIEAAPDAATALRRTGWTAVALARRGRGDAARRLVERVL